MGIINPIIDMDAIGKYIGNKIYMIADKKGISQTEMAKKIGVSQANISAFLTGKRTTTNLDQYWRIAESIPLSRSEFDNIVDEAKQRVLGVSSDTNNDPLVSLAEKESLTPGQLEKVKSFIQFVKTQE